MRGSSILDTHAVTGDARLGNLEERCANPVSVADTHLVVGQALYGEVLSELSVGEIAPTQTILPVPIRLDLVNEHRSMLAAMTLQIALPIAVDDEPPDPAPPLHRLFPDRGVNGLPPPGDVAWKAYING